MPISVLEKDSAIKFPQSIILKASAGSGKTHTLTKRFVQFLLSDIISHNGLPNILAITFSNNAAKEMKERILLWLKDIYFEDEHKLCELEQIICLGRVELIRKAEVLIDKILDNYTEFGVKTIDSFLVSIYKASAVDLGYSPDFEILMNNDYIMDYGFELFWRELPQVSILEEIIDHETKNRQAGQSYPWDPSPILLENIKGLYHKLSATGKQVNIPDHKAALTELETRITVIAGELEKSIEKSGLARSKNSTFGKILENAQNGRYANLIGLGFANCPVTKKVINDSYNNITDTWGDLGEALRQYHKIYARSYFVPYLRVYETFKNTLEAVKKKESVVFIEEVSKNLAEYINRDIVPDVYFRLGETIFHYLIDEFQDTSPLQWSNLLPLIENSLSQGGSFLAVGDTKQSIYRFRNADYRIMKEMESANPFPSSDHCVRELNVNYRSFQGICDFNERVFIKTVAANDKYAQPAQRSGLTDYDQKVKEEHETLGHVEVLLFDKDDDTEKQEIQRLIGKLRETGYSYSDIAVLTFRNEDVVNVSAWLNEKDTPFISYSSLDVRKRKITGEIISLLKFLDSPPDDLSFVIFLLGNIFRKILDKHNLPLKADELHTFLFNNRKPRPFYKEFQDNYGQIWDKYFSRLFKTVGYLPLYDLVCEIYRIFEVFDTFQNEQATVIKVLEVIKDFEDTGKNNLRDFIKYTESENMGSHDWNVNIPADMDAVKVMTVHKAKGLGFPVVIVLLYNDSFSGFTHIISEDDTGVNLLKINEKIAKAVPEYDLIYQEEKNKELTDKLNALYVGFSRAKRELYVVGVGKKDKYPLDILSGLAEYKYLSPGDNAPVLRKPETALPGLPLFNYRIQEIFAAQAVKMLNPLDAIRGQFIHEVLYLIDYIETDLEAKLEQHIEQINRQSGRSIPVAATKYLLLKFLLNKQVQEYFLPKPMRKILKEQDFSDSKGNLFRMDRVIVDKNRVTVIDFKTGADHDSDKYRSQINNYLYLLKDIYPHKNTAGVIAYIDLNKVTYIQ